MKPGRKFIKGCFVPYPEGNGELLNGFKQENNMYDQEWF